MSDSNTYEFEEETLRFFTFKGPGEVAGVDRASSSDVWGSGLENPTPSENTSSLPQSQVAPWSMAQRHRPDVGVNKKITFKVVPS